MQITNGMDSEYRDYVEKNSGDPYSQEVVRYGERWADLMEKGIPADASDADVAAWIAANASATSHEADTSGITGFMYGCAVSALSLYWKHGEQLRRWHNKETQIGDEGDRANAEGGVLNPALLTIGNADND